MKKKEKFETNGQMFEKLYIVLVVGTMTYIQRHVTACTELFVYTTTFCIHLMYNFLNIKIPDALDTQYVL